MKTPESVKSAAKGLIEMYGDHFDYLGEYKGAEFYAFHFPEDEETGFPFVYQVEGSDVLEITGSQALDIISLFVKE